MSAKRVSIDPTDVVSFLSCLIFALLSSGVLFPLASQAADRPEYAKDPCTDSEARKQLAADNCGKDEECRKASLKRIIDSCFQRYENQPNPQAAECKDAFKEYNQDEGKMNAACGTAGIGGDCFKHIDKCMRCQGTDSTNPDCETLDTVTIDEELDPDKRPASINDILGMASGKPKTLSKQKYAPSASKARVRYKNCPAMAGNDLKEWMDRTKSAQETVQDKKKDISKLEAQNGKIDRDLLTQSEEFDEDAQKLVDKSKAVSNEMTAAIKDEKNNTRNTIAKLLDQMDRIDEQIDATTTAFDNAYNAYLNALATLDQQCHAAALQKLNAKQTKMQGLINASRYSRGSFSDLAGMVGVSDREKAQIQVNKDFLRCKQDPSYNASAAAAKRALNAADKAAKRAKSSLRARQDKMALAIQDAEERGLPEAIQEIITQANQRLQELQTALSQLATRKQNAIKRAAQRKMENMKKIELAKQDLDIAEQALKQYQAYLNEKMVASGGVTSDSSKVTEALNALTQVRSSALTVVAACGCDVPPKTTKDAKGKTIALPNSNRSSCLKACDTLVKASDEYDSSTSISAENRAEYCEVFEPVRGGGSGGRNTTVK